MLLADLPKTLKSLLMPTSLLIFCPCKIQPIAAACTAFLGRIEAGEVRGVTSVFSLNEAFYAMLIGKGSELLNSTKIKQIKAKLAVDAALSSACYQACLEFSRYVTVLRATGLRLVEADYNLQVNALSLSATSLVADRRTPLGHLPGV
ncbi:MAG: hypothetical protein U0401_09575 [Anaerolineae bacterium]